MRTHFVLGSFLTILITLTPCLDARASSCDPREYGDHIRLSEWVFLGTAVEAWLDLESTGLINFSLTDIDRLRGNPPDTVELRARQGAYDPRITIGQRYIVYTDSGGEYVGRCTGFASLGFTETFISILFREEGQCGSEQDRYAALAHLLEEFLGSDERPSRSIVRMILGRFSEVFPNAVVFEGDDVLLMKGFEFKFEGDSLTSIELGECDA